MLTGLKICDKVYISNKNIKRGVNYESDNSSIW